MRIPIDELKIDDIDLKAEYFINWEFNTHYGGIVPKPLHKISGLQLHNWHTFIMGLPRQSIAFSSTPGLWVEKITDQKEYTYIKQEITGLRTLLQYHINENKTLQTQIGKLFNEIEYLKGEINYLKDNTVKTD